MLKTFKKTDVKPGKVPVMVARINLFKNLYSILHGLKSPGIPKKVLANMKKDIIKHIRSYPEDKIIEKITEFSITDLLHITRTISEPGAAVDISSLVKQFLVKEVKKEVEAGLKISLFKKKRGVLDLFFDENPTWREKSLSQLIDQLYQPKKKTELSEDDEILLIDMLTILDKSPPLPIPTHLLHKFLLESDFVPNTDGDEKVFVKKYGLYSLKQQIEEGKDLKEITPTLNLISERSRKYYRVRFFNLKQVKEMVQAYDENPFKLDFILREFVTNRDVKLVDVKGNIIPKPIKSTAGKNSFTSAGPKALSFGTKPYLYMITRPWIPNLKEIQISTVYQPYINDLLYVDKDGYSWFSPSSDFFSDCTKTTRQEGNILYLRDGSNQVRVKYILYSGKHVLQDEALYKREEDYFATHATYTLSFLETAAKTISIGLLNLEHMGILRQMGVQIIGSALSKVLDSKRFNLDAMSSEILAPISQKSETIKDYFKSIFQVVKKFDVGTCFVARFHHVYHDRIRRFFYRLESLSTLPDRLAFPEKKHLKDLDDAVTRSMNYFIHKHLFEFRAKLFPYERIREKIDVPRIRYDAPYPSEKMTKDCLYQIGQVDLRTAASLVMNDMSHEVQDIEELQTYFDFDYVYYEDNVDVFVGYPLYFIVEKEEAVLVVEKPPTDEEKETDFEHFWEQFQERLVELEGQPKNKYPLIIAGAESEPVSVLDESGDEDNAHPPDEDEEDEDHDFYSGFPDLHEEDDD